MSCHLQAGEASPESPNTVGSGTTEATDVAEITPNADGFVCAVARAAAFLRSGGIRIRVSTAGTVGDSTVKGSLVVADAGTGQDLSEELLVCDHPNGVAPVAGLILHAAGKLAIANAGDRINLVWRETGAIGDTGARPGFQILLWPLCPIASETV